MLFLNCQESRFLLEIMRDMICWRKHSLFKDHRIHIVMENQENYVLENIRKSQEKTAKFH